MEKMYKIVVYNKKGNITKKKYYSDVKRFEKEKKWLTEWITIFKVDYHLFSAFETTVNWDENK